MNDTILIVDDVMLNIDMLTEILDENYTVMAAVSGENAIKLLNRRKPDLVLLDLSMPGIDGFEVLQFIKENKELANIPVIFVTGEHDEFAEEKGLALGAVDYIKKPYNASIVKTKVRNHLELKAYRDKLELLVSERTKKLEERTKQLAASSEAIIMCMSLMSEGHDGVTGEHIGRIKKYTKILAKKMLEMYPDLLTRETAEQTVLFSPLHDVGKVFIPDGILKKAGPLTPEEFDIIKTHTLHAAELLRKAEKFFTDAASDDFQIAVETAERFFMDGAQNNLQVAVEIAESHHEKYDGTGYPFGLKGEEIPISARIVAVADVYDALRSTRPYKEALSHSEAVDIILSGDAKTTPEQFDAKVLEAFKSVHEEFARVED